MIEERCVFCGTAATIAQRAREDGLKACFQYVRRTLGCQILGFANASGAQKFARFLKSFSHEIDDDLFERRRHSGSAWLADQGVDLALGDCPHVEGNLLALIKSLQSGEVDLRSGQRRAAYFFPNAITIPEGLHMLFGGLKDGLRAQAAWTNYEPILRELVTTVGSQMFRDRFRAQCMDGADKEERRLMYHFSKARFDWRWEILEVTSGDLADRWPILKRYADWENIYAVGHLADVGIEHLRRTLANDPANLPAIELMTNATHAISQAQGHNSRWLKTCDCCNPDLGLARVVPLQRKHMPDKKPCSLAARRLVHLIHGGLVQMKENIRHASTPRLNLLLMQAPASSREMALEFSTATKAYLEQHTDEKLGFVLEVPVLFVGLFGTFFFFDVLDCVAIGRRLLEYGQENQNNPAMHRVAVTFYESPALLTQLQAFVDARGAADITHFPGLFMYIIKYVLVTVVGHYLEGRHRYVALQLAGSGATTKPALQSFIMRGPEHRDHLACEDFLNFVSAEWRSKTSLTSLLDTTYEVSE